MATTTFAAGTVIASTWLNDVDAIVYDAVVSVPWTTVTWSGTNVTHSGNHTWSGNMTFNGNTVIGNAAGDTLTIAPSAVTWSNNPTHSGNHSFSGNALFIGATSALGYGTGSGGTVTQATSKATGVTLNTSVGRIVMNNASLAATTSVTFALTNSTIAATDLVVLNLQNGSGSSNSYVIQAQPDSGACAIHVRNITAGALAEALIINFAVIKGVIA